MQKERKNNLSQGKIKAPHPHPPWISNGPSLTAYLFQLQYKFIDLLSVPDTRVLTVEVTVTVWMVLDVTYDSRLDKKYSDYWWEFTFAMVLTVRITQCYNNILLVFTEGSHLAEYSESHSHVLVSEKLDVSKMMYNSNNCFPFFIDFCMAISKRKISRTHRPK